MSRFRKSADADDTAALTEEPPLSTNPFAPPADPGDEAPTDAAIVDDPAPPPPPSGAGPQPLIVTVSLLQETVVRLEQGLQEQLGAIASRLDALDERAAAADAAAADASAAPADGETEPAWVQRLEAAIDGLGASGAASTAAAITTMGEQQRNDLAQLQERIVEISQPQPSADPQAADLAATVAQLCTDLTIFTDEVRRGFGDVSSALHEQPGGPATDPDVIARLDDIRAALRLVVG